MRVVAINEAEAIIEPFWDGGSSEHPRDKLSLLSNYRVTLGEGARGSLRQIWCAAEVSIPSAPPGVTALAMQCACDLRLEGYDIFRVFASLPHWVRMRIVGDIDGQERVIVAQAEGTDTNDELDGPLVGRHLTSLRLEFELTEDRASQLNLYWLGLANRAAQTRMEARSSPYTADWPGSLALPPGPTEPQVGIFFGREELAELRRKCQVGPFKEVLEALRQRCQQDLRATPEEDIGFFVPNPDRRWCRNRDMQRKCTAGTMERLAFVGLVDCNLEMCTLAARMALSAAHCDTWCESVMGVFPGATWHHRSFTEEIYCRACALVLDWAGFCLTPHGQQIIRDAIIMKGLPRIESDFKRMEYIRHMNQGIVFSSGRVVGLLSLLPAHPRYKSAVQEAERDLHEMVGAYVHSDGGTLEGMAYWDYTFGTTLPLFCALARYRGQTLKQYATPALAKTGDYALAMLSTLGDGTTYLPVNDAHADETIRPSLVAAFCQISDRPEWQALYAAMLCAGKVGTDMFSLFVASPTDAGPVPVARPTFRVLPDVGQASTIRHAPDLGLVHLHLCSGPTYGGHYHQDKGAFILEVGNETLAMDRGVTSYDHPETHLIGTAGRHNLLYPEGSDEAPIEQPGNVPGGILTCGREEHGVVLLTSDNTAAWEAGLFRRNVRRIVSPCTDLFLFDDDVELGRPRAMSFRISTLYPIVWHDGEGWVQGKHASLRVVPLNWSPVQTTATVEGVDCHLQPTNLLRLISGPDTTHRLLTALSAPHQP